MGDVSLPTVLIVHDVITVSAHNRCGHHGDRTGQRVSLNREMLVLIRSARHDHVGERKTPSRPFPIEHREPSVTAHSPRGGLPYGDTPRGDGSVLLCETLG